MKNTIILFAMLLSLLFSQTGSTQIPDDVIKEIDLRVEHGLNTSIVVGVFADGKSHFYAQGFQNKALKIPASTESVYEIGSISKTYTGLLLAIMAEKHGFKIDDAVQNHWPKPFKLEDSNNQAITFKQLATHSSGLPRLPNNLNLFSDNPYANYSRNDLISGVMNTTPKNAGAQYAYSNLGAGLLGESMAVIAAQSYNSLIEQHILKPLNLNQTYMLLNEVPTNRLAQGYDGKSPTTAWEFEALAGAGSIRSSIRDLLAYGVAYLKPKNDHLNDAMKLATSVHYHTGEAKVGLGWHFSHSGHLWHNGATAGFSSMLMIDTKNQKAVAVITNSNHKNNVEDIAVHLMDPSKPMRDNEFPVAISENELKPYIGHYFHQESAQSIHISIQADELFLDATKLIQQPLTYIGNDTFKISLIKLKLQFKRDQDGQINALSLSGWGEPQTYTKQ